MTVVFKNVAILMLFAVIGFVLAKFKKVDSKSTKFLSTLVVFVFLPATTFKSFATNFTVQYIKEKYDIMLQSIKIWLLRCN